LLSNLASVSFCLSKLLLCAIYCCCSWNFHFMLSHLVTHVPFLFQSIRALRFIVLFSATKIMLSLPVLQSDNHVIWISGTVNNSALRTYNNCLFFSTLSYRSRLQAYIYILSWTWGGFGKVNLAKIAFYNELIHSLQHKDMSLNLPLLLALCSFCWRLVAGADLLWEISTVGW
jgi:hypothetical protein